jgi:hypothetical protein
MCIREDAHRKEGNPIAAYRPFCGAQARWQTAPPDNPKPFYSQLSQGFGILWFAFIC